MILFIKLFLVSLFFSISLNGIESKQNLYKHPYWLKLLHYENGKSIINNKKFFLSKEGIHNPQKELEATLKAFEDDQQICKYPARFKWLNKKLNLKQKKISCDKLKKFLSFGAKSFSVVFTSQRYNSPASVFGHTFIKIKSQTIDYAINYSAKINEDDNIFAYIYNGLNGNYPGSYKILPYSYKEYEYRSYEFRDLIEFELKLSKDEIENILYHLFEIDGLVQNYYFVGHNCSSELLKLIDMKDDRTNMSQKLKKVVLPIEIIYILEQNNLIGSIKQSFSKLKIFYNYISQLSKKNLDTFDLLINHQISIDKFAKDNSIQNTQKNLLILSAIKYYEILSTTGKFQTKSIYPLLKLINLKQKRDIDEGFTTQVLKQNPVLNKFQKFSFGYKYDEKKKYMSIGYRNLYRSRFDMIDLSSQNGSVEFFDINFILNQNNIKLDYFNLINLESVPISNNIFQETTNRITLGAKKIILEDNLFAFFEYTTGYKVNLIKNLYFKPDFGIGVYHRSNPLGAIFIQNALEYKTASFNSVLKSEYKVINNNIIFKKYSFDNYFKLKNNISFIVSLLKEHQEERDKTLINNQISFKFNIIF